MVFTIELATRASAIDTEPEALSIELLSNRCREEVARYHRGEPCDDKYSFDLFRRAVAGGEEAAWVSLHSIFNDQVLAWCRLASGRAADADDLVSVAWEKFWVNFTPAKLAASNCGAAVLRYLKMCARSAAIDSARVRLPAFSLDESPIEEPDRDPAPADAQAENDARSRFWAIVNAALRDERERVLAHLTYECGLKSAEVQAQRPDLFPDTCEVYRATRNLLDRLRRNRALLAWVDDDRS